MEATKLLPWLTIPRRSHWSAGGQCWGHTQILIQPTASTCDSFWDRCTSLVFSWREPEVAENLCSPPYSPHSAWGPYCMTDRYGICTTNPTDLGGNDPKATSYQSSPALGTLRPHPYLTASPLPSQSPLGASP